METDDGFAKEIADRLAKIAARGLDLPWSKPLAKTALTATLQWHDRFDQSFGATATDCSEFLDWPGKTPPFAEKWIEEIAEKCVEEIAEKKCINLKEKFEETFGRRPPAIDWDFAEKCIEELAEKCIEEKFESGRRPP